jgi:hypothetical protein
MAESVGWTIAQETLEGFTAQGTSFGHAGVANIHIAVFLRASATLREVIDQGQLGFHAKAPSSAKTN